MVPGHQWSEDKKKLNFYKEGPKEKRETDKNLIILEDS